MAWLLAASSCTWLVGSVCEKSHLVESSDRISLAQPEGHKQRQQDSGVSWLSLWCFHPCGGFLSGFSVFGNTMIFLTDGSRRKQDNRGIP